MKQTANCYASKGFCSASKMVQKFWFQDANCKNDTKLQIHHVASQNEIGRYTNKIPTCWTNLENHLKYLFGTKENIF